MDIEFNEEESDVMMRLQDSDGRDITFITAPSGAFGYDELGPIITGFDNQIILAFNEDKIQRMIEEAVEEFGEKYGSKSAVFLPISQIMQIGIDAVEKYVKENYNK
jgi:hypothetical protein